MKIRKILVFVVVIILFFTGCIKIAGGKVWNKGVPENAIAVYKPVECEGEIAPNAEDAAFTTYYIVESGRDLMLIEINERMDDYAIMNHWVDEENNDKFHCAIADVYYAYFTFPKNRKLPGKVILIKGKMGEKGSKTVITGFSENNIENAVSVCILEPVLTE